MYVCMYVYVIDRYMIYICILITIMEVCHIAAISGRQFTFFVRRMRWRRHRQDAYLGETCVERGE